MSRPSGLLQSPCVLMFFLCSYLPGRANVVADSLSRNLSVGSVAEMPSKFENFTLQDLAAAQHQHDVWSKVIFALESGDTTSFPPLPVSFSQFFLSPDRVLCRYWPRKKEPVAQFVVTECFIPAVLNLVHDTVVAGHPGRERTLAAARAVYFWPTMRVDTYAYVDRCAKCAQHISTMPRPPPILGYPPPDRPWDVVSIDLLQLPASWFV